VIPVLYQTLLLVLFPPAVYGIHFLAVVSEVFSSCVSGLCPQSLFFGLSLVAMASL